MEFNCAYFGRLHKAERKPGKNGEYWMITLRNEETFKEFRFSSFSENPVKGLSIGDAVTAYADSTQKGFNHDVRLVTLEKSTA